MKSTSEGLLMVACAACQAPIAVLAADPLGFYVGGAWGESTVRDDNILLRSTPTDGVYPPVGVPTRYGYDFDEHHSAWKVTLGMRPLPVVGAELEYLDFGHPSVTTAVAGMPLVADVQAKGPALFAVGYLPLPIPLLDLYGKVGVADVRTTANANNVGHPYCPPLAPCPTLAWIPSTYYSSRSDASVAYGVGAQVKLASFAIRLEYERVSESYGDPELLSLGATWSFL